MMKGAAEKAVQMQVMPGQSGARQGPRARLEADQVLADFEGLLARQSAGHDMPLDKLDAAPADNRTEPAPRATPEALFLALAGSADFVAQEETTEPRLEDDGIADDGEPARIDERQLQSVPMRAEAPAMMIEAGTVRPQMQMATKEEKGAPPSAKLHAAVADASPLMNVKRGEARADDPAPSAPDDVPDDSPAVAGKRNPKIAEEAPVADKAARTQDGAPPVTLIRVAGQETHFAPPLAPVPGDQKIDALPLSEPAGPDRPGRAQPALPPIAVKMPSGPLRTLKVELGSHELGLVNATVALKDKSLDLKIGAARDDAVASLKENAGKLSDALQALGYSVDGISVQKLQQGDAGNQTGNGQFAQQDAGGQDARGQGQQRTSGGSGFGSENSSGQSRYTHRDDHLAEQEGNDQSKSAAVSRNSRGVFL